MQSFCDREGVAEDRRITMDRESRMVIDFVASLLGESTCQFIMSECITLEAYCLGPLCTVLFPCVTRVSLTMLCRCWRQFRQSRCTTYALAKDYAACGLNEKSVTSISFEQLASRITSPITLRTVKALLARIESRLKLSLECQSSKMTCIDHLLKRLSPPARKPRVSIGSTQGKKHPSKAGDTSKAAAQTQSTPIASKAKEGQKPVPKELERYPVRVFLCAYMILGQPEAVFSSRGERELALAETAAKLLPEFEALTGIVLDGPSSGSPGPSSPNSSPPKMSKYDWPSDVSTTSALPSPRPFAAQLAAFDAAWCAYLYKFVAWKVKDAKVLEEDMTRMACQLEVSMLQKCRIPHGGNISDLSHDAKAIRTQVCTKFFQVPQLNSALGRDHCKR